MPDHICAFAGRLASANMCFLASSSERRGRVQKKVLRSLPSRSATLAAALLPAPGADASSAKEAGRRGHFDRLVHRVIFHLCRAHLGRRLALEGVENIFLGLSWLLSPAITGRVACASACWSGKEDVAIEGEANLA
jgi:hypothetical protein